MNLTSVMIGTEDPQRLASYYTELFGKPAWEDNSYTGWQLGKGWLTIGAHDEVKGQNAAPGRVMWIVEAEDVEGESKKLKDAGAIVVKEPYKLGEPPREMWIATFADPDGNYFQLMSPMDM